MKNNQKIKGPKDAATSEGPNAKAVEAIALTEGYTKADGPGKEKSGGPAEPIAAGITRARAKALATRMSGRRAQLPKAAFCDSAGRKWTYRGKRARVLAMRADGLVIDTEREGEYRHARHRLRTPGTLFQQPETGEAR